MREVRVPERLERLATIATVQLLQAIDRVESREPRPNARVDPGERSRVVLVALSFRAEPQELSASPGLSADLVDDIGSSSVHGAPDAGGGPD